MASVLRVGKHLPKLILYSQTNSQVLLVKCNAVERYSQWAKKIYLHRGQPYVTQIAQQTNGYERRNFQAQPFSLDDALQKLDLSVRRTGRITRKEIEDVYVQLQKIGKATSTQSLLLLRCCGSLLADELPANRTELVSSILETFRRIGIQFDVSHYNSLLKVYLENEHIFNPSEFLAELEGKGIVPNRVTYLRLIEYYCQTGDIEGAGKILEFMKQKELPINEKVFNALILGHARANDMENAKSVLDMMKNANLEPSSETYAALLSAYAEKGDMQSLRETLRHVQKQDIKLFNEDYLNIIYVLAKNGFAEHVEELFDKLQPAFGFVNDSINTILKLISCGQEEIAFKLFQRLPPAVKPSGESVPGGIFFIRQLIRLDKPADSILHYCREMQRLKLNSSALLKATEIAFVQRKEELAVAFLKALKKEDFPIRPHYFWPILSVYKKKNEQSKVYETARLMMELGCPANYHTFAEYIFPAITIQDTNLLIEHFKEYGYSTGEIVGPLVEQLLNNFDLTRAVALLEKYMVRVNPRALVLPLAAAYLETKDTSATLTILKKMKEAAANELTRGSRSDLMGMFVLECVRLKLKNNSATEIEPLFQSMIKENLNIGQDTCDIIKQRIWTNIPESTVMILQELASLSLDMPVEELDQQYISHPREMSIEDLENHLIELKGKNMNTRGVLRRLLIAHSQKKNLERALEIKQELDSDDFTYSPAMLAQMLELFVHHAKLNEATELFNQIRSFDTDFLLDDHKIINYCTLLVKEDKFDDAIKILSETKPKKKRTEKYAEGNVWRLLNAAAEKDADKTNKLFDLMMKQEYCDPTNVILGPLIKVHLKNNDLPKAIEKFEEVSKTYSQTPWRREIFKELIIREDAEVLQRVVDISNKIHGEGNTLHDLAFSLLECGRIREARKVFETPGLRAKQHRLDIMCEKLLEENKLTELEELVKITEDLFDLDRDHMFFNLIRGCYKLKDPKKALGVWTTMQEENVQPSDRTLIYLSNFLKEYNEPIPFIVPDPKVESPSNLVMSSLREGKIDEAIDIKRRLQNSGTSLNLSENSNLINSLVLNGRLTEALNLTKEMLDHNWHPQPRVFKSLLHQIAKSGDIETIKSLELKLSENVKKLIRYNNMLCIAHISSNKHLEFLENLEKDVENSVKTCPTGAFLHLLSLHPDLIDRVEKLGKEYAKHDFHNLLNVVWENYFIQEDFKKADKILQETPFFQTSLSFRSIINHAVKNKNENLLEKLLTVVKSTQLPQTAWARIYNSIIDIQCAEKNVDKAVKTVERAQSETIANQLHPTTLRNLKDLIQQEGKTIPPSVSTLNVTSGNVIDDSDSDTERHRRKQ